MKYCSININILLILIIDIVNKSLYFLLVSFRWPNIFHLYDRQQSYSWKCEFKKRHIFRVQLHHFISRMSPEFYSKEELSDDDFKEIVDMTGSQLASESLLDELLSILHDGAP